MPLFAYLYVLIAVTLFPIQIFTKNTSVYSDGFGKQSMLLNLNALYIQNYSLLQIVGNLLLLAPLAFFLALFFAKLRGLGRNLLVCALVSLAIETLQLIMNFFYLSYRTFDITDFILNSIGSLLGLAAFEIVYIIFRESVDKVTPS
ncbi:VanZ family protein [Lacticaseibacillus paracasei]|uniref:VanZ family protein n=1 Tax=Lacticaseibacillus paracasei TaxID=1597 RepID=UPI003A5CB2E3